MPDKRFFVTHPPLPLFEAVDIAGGELLENTNSNAKVDRVAGLDEPSLSGAVVYAENKPALTKLVGRVFGLCLVKNTDGVELIAGKGAIAIHDNPRRGFATLSARLHDSQRFDPSKAGVDPLAKISENARIHASAVIAANAEIGDDVEIGPFVAIGPGVAIGRSSRVGAGASVTHAIVGDRVIIWPGARIGQQGFGFADSEDGLVRVPQLGRVIIGDDVEVGANTTIDRGALGDTVIGAGTKIDNLVQIGHNVRIGRNSIIVAQVGVSGSCTIGDRVILSGKVGIADHLTIGDDVKVGAGSRVMRNIPAGEAWGGYPARLLKKWLRETAVLTKLAGTGKKTERNDD